MKPIRKNNLSLINLWYNQVDSFGFATGGKNPEDIVLTDKNSFLSGIYPYGGINCIGLIAGEFKPTKESVLWIKTFLIDTSWQRKYFGTHSFNLLIDYAAKNFRIKKVYVSVSAENQAGINFWIKMGLLCIKIIRYNIERDRVLILEKVI